MSIISFLGLGPVFDVDPLFGCSEEEMELLYERYLAGDTCLPPEVIAEFDMQTKNAPPSVENQKGTFSINGPPPAYYDIEKGIPAKKPKHVVYVPTESKPKAKKKTYSKK
ncbi:hypothetical protein LOD99_11871 [Oopsacas minuta]|uniref:Uncharacterized protein n=1 Tax=Oopsacas minuta TaxID=111878 RepID=A0AAV7JL62_9METZ|nr:hypothetical protein LOD99_11871 [Oopsacas minuta]